MPHDITTEPTDDEAWREHPAAPDRRSVMALGAATALGVGVGVTTLAACGSGSSGGGTSPAAAAPGGPLAKVSDVPVGGAKSATGPDGKPIVITRPTAEKVEAVSAICTHMGCSVLVQGTKLNCPCHGSQFDLTGKVLQGPAAAPLPPVAVKVSGTDIVAG